MNKETYHSRKVRIVSNPIQESKTIGHPLSETSLLSLTPFDISNYSGIQRFYKKWGKDYLPENLRKNQELGLGTMVEEDIWRFKEKNSI